MTWRRVAGVGVVVLVGLLALTVFVVSGWESGTSTTQAKPTSESVSEEEAVVEAVQAKRR